MLTRKILTLQEISRARDREGSSAPLWGAQMGGEQNCQPRGLCVRDALLFSWEVTGELETLADPIDLTQALCPKLCARYGVPPRSEPHTVPARAPAPVADITECYRIRPSCPPQSFSPERVELACHVNLPSHPHAAGKSRFSNAGAGMYWNQCINQMQEAKEQCDERIEEVTKKGNAAGASRAPSEQKDQSQQVAGHDGGRKQQKLGADDEYNMDENEAESETDKQAALVGNDKNRNGRKQQKLGADDEYNMDENEAESETDKQAALVGNDKNRNGQVGARTQRF
ncbi:hypothetical protein CB1_000978002 [Camelus ferus]|nr:hypothetical protein CB1_000978002 [Camelus ferus]